MKIAVPTQLEEKLRTLSTLPGVYIFKDVDGRVLYVGKAKRLRPRVRSYFRDFSGHGIKNRELVRRIADVETIVVRTEVEALLLEANLIKAHTPPFNIKLKDDKAYPYIRITCEPDPEVRLVRRMAKDGATYFGPYTDVRRMRQALDTVRRLYTVTAEYFEHRGSEEERRALINDMVAFLGGKPSGVIDRLTEAMKQAATSLLFELAANYRDAITALESLRRQAQTQGVQLQKGDYDAVAVARDAERATAIRLQVRKGRLVHSETRLIENAAGQTESALIRAALFGFYLDLGAESAYGVARRMLLPRKLKGREALEAALTERAGHRVQLFVPVRGDRRQVIDLAIQNARHRLEEELLIQKESDERAGPGVFALQQGLGLARVPRSIVCFDIAHLQGTDVVASAVTFRNGEAYKGGYRRLKIRGDWGNDDFRSMREAVTRYLEHLKDREEPWPDLIVIDGGKGQLAVARAALRDAGADIQICSLAKQEEEVFLPGESVSIRLPRTHSGLRLLQRIRDEAHRFANTYTAKLRGKRVKSTVLTSVPGIGPARAKRLLRHFGSVSKIRVASAEDVARAAGISQAKAEDLLRQING